MKLGRSVMSTRVKIELDSFGTRDKADTLYSNKYRTSTEAPKTPYASMTMTQSRCAKTHINYFLLLRSCAPMSECIVRLMIQQQI